MDPWKPTAEQLVETTDDLDEALRVAEWRMWRKSLFHSWPHERFSKATQLLRELREECGGTP